MIFSWKNNVSQIKPEDETFDKIYANVQILHLPRTNSTFS